MPGISASGNMIPQSTMRMRSSTSRQKQLRPISPRPPRKTILTGGFMWTVASWPQATGALNMNSSIIGFMAASTSSMRTPSGSRWYANCIGAVSPS